MKAKLFVLLLCGALSACASYEERALTSLHQEEVHALTYLPCEGVGEKSFWNRNNHSFLCTLGVWSNVSYIIYTDDENKSQVEKAKLIWKEYKENSFFPSNKKDVDIVLSQLSDYFAPNDRSAMLKFSSSLNTYTFYTDYLKIKHTTDYYSNTPEPYFLHEVLLENL